MSNLAVLTRKNENETLVWDHSDQFYQAVKLQVTNLQNGFSRFCNVTLFGEISFVVSTGLQRNCSTTAVVWPTVGHSA